MRSRFVGENYARLAAAGDSQTCINYQSQTFVHGPGHAYKLLQPEAELRGQVAGVPVQDLGACREK